MTTITRHAGILMLAATMIAASLPASAQTTSEDAMIRITFTTGDQTLAATLDDTAAARDFASMLPLEVTLTDYHGIEKVADLGRQLDDSGAPRAYTPRAGDITQYRPWSNLALFLQPFQSSPGLIRLGAFDGPIDALRREGPVSVRIERAD